MVFLKELLVSYSKVDDAIRLLVKMRKGALMAKTDIKSTYRIIPSMSKYTKQTDTF